MCACCQKKTFFIEDILKDISAKNSALRNANYDPVTRNKSSGQVEEYVRETSFQEISNSRVVEIDNESRQRVHAQKEQELSNKVDVEQRRNTCPLYPTVLRVNVGWPAYGSGGVGGVGKFAESLSYPGNADTRHLFTYFSDPLLNGSPILRNHLAANRYMPHILAMRPGLDYDWFDGVSIGWCKPWWGTGGRRKGGQVRFSAAQTGALERRFGASKYLSPDERRALASTLSLSDRQVKTWFQNRRAKWRRTASDPADACSPVPAEDDVDED